MPQVAHILTLNSAPGEGLYKNLTPGALVETLETLPSGGDYLLCVGNRRIRFGIAVQERETTRIDALLQTYGAPDQRVRYARALDEVMCYVADYNRDEATAEDALRSINEHMSAAGFPIGLGFGFCETCNTAMIAPNGRELCPRCDRAEIEAMDLD